MSVCPKKIFFMMEILIGVSITELQNDTEDTEVQKKPALP
jgi:hypothetical protein